MKWLRVGLDMPVGRWKALLIAFTLLSAVALIVEIVAAASALARGTTGDLGIRGDDIQHDGRRAMRVRSFSPSSAAPQAGVQVGDIVT